MGFKMTKMVSTNMISSKQKPSVPLEVSPLCFNPSCSLTIRVIDDREYGRRRVKKHLIGRLSGFPLGAVF